MVDRVDHREEITRLELRIEELARAAEICRKIELAAKAVLVIGAASMISIVFGIVRPLPIFLIGATSAIVGGIVLYGSNASTAKQYAALLREAEVIRGALIDTIDFRTMNE